MNYCVPPNATPEEIRFYTRLLGLTSPLASTDHRGPHHPTDSNQQTLAHSHLQAGERVKEGRNGNGTGLISHTRGQQPVTMRAVSDHEEDEHGLPLQLRGAAEEGAVAHQDTSSPPTVSTQPAQASITAAVPSSAANGLLNGPVHTEPLAANMARYSSDSVLSTISAADHTAPQSTTHLPAEDTAAEPTHTASDPSSLLLPVPPAPLTAQSPSSNPQSRSSSTGSSSSGQDGARGRDGKWRQHQQLVPRMSLETVEKARDVDDRPPQRPTRRRSSHTQQRTRGPAHRAEGEPPTKDDKQRRDHEKGESVAKKQTDPPMPRWGRAQSEELDKMKRRGDVSPSIEETNV